MLNKRWFFLLIVIAFVSYLYYFASFLPISKNIIKIAHGQGIPTVVRVVGNVAATVYQSNQNDTAFTAYPGTKPAFSQNFPIMNFNADRRDIKCSNGSVSTLTRPFTDVVPHIDGTCSFIIVQGNGKQAGVNQLFSFNMVMTGVFNVSQAGNVKFTYRSDDGWILSMDKAQGISNAQPTYVSGTRYNTPSKGIYTGYRLMGGYNGNNAPKGDNVIINFPVAGNYPFEIDYFEVKGAELAFDVRANGKMLLMTKNISGNVFLDNNKNGIQDAGEPNYTGNISITSSGGIVNTNLNGSYTINDLIDGGVYTVSYTSLPSGYIMTAPINGPPPSHQVTVGLGCNTNGANGATCDALGNINTLNFGINNNHPWVQSVCGDIRIDSGVSNKEPLNESMITTNANCTNPGVVFTGDATADFGQGQVSGSNQIVGGTTYPEMYDTLGTSALFSSYANLIGKAQSAGITPTNLSSVCNLSNCTLPPTLPHGIYQANDNVSLNAFTFPTNQNYVFLIKGTLTINGNVIVPPDANSSVLFATTNDIIIPSTVGSAALSTTPNLSGIYSTDKSFILQSANNCNDLRFNLEGTLIVNAARNGGSLQNNRDLCGNDPLAPTMQITQRLDFVLNLPDFIRSQQIISQEVAL